MTDPPKADLAYICKSRSRQFSEMKSFKRPVAPLLVGLLIVMGNIVVVSGDQRCDSKLFQCAPKTPTEDKMVHETGSRSQIRTQLLFSTPLLRTHMSAFVSNVTEFNRALGKAILKDFKIFRKLNNENDPEHLNDDFFAYQQGHPLDMSPEELEEVRVRASKLHYRNTHQFAILENAVAALASHAARDVLHKQIAGYEENQNYDEDLDAGEPIVVDNFHSWAAVHFKRGKHAMHFHENSALSAVYYVSVPEGSGELTLYDPRGPRPPFEQIHTIYPQEGDLVMFPGWLGHAVGETGDTGNVPRISIPFNGEGTWEQSSNVPPDEWSATVGDFAYNGPQPAADSTTQ